MAEYVDTNEYVVPQQMGEPRYEELHHPGGQHLDHKVRTVTKVITKRWPPDSYFEESAAVLAQMQARAEAEEKARAEARMRAEKAHEEEYGDEDAEEQAYMLEIKNAYAKPPASPFVPRTSPVHPVVNPSFGNRQESVLEPPQYTNYLDDGHVEPAPKMTTKVTVRKWPPDSWFEDARQKARQPLPHQAHAPHHAQAHGTPSRGGHYPHGQEESVAMPVTVPRTLPPDVDHTPIPIRDLVELGMLQYPEDTTAPAYNPHGFWPYRQGQPPLRASKAQFVPPPPEEPMYPQLPPMQQFYPPQQQRAAPPPQSPPQPAQYPREHSAVPIRREPSAVPSAVPRGRPSDSYVPQSQSYMAPPRENSMHMHHHMHAPQTPTQQFVDTPMDIIEEGEHFQCLGCGCHIRPSEVMYRPRTVPCLPPDVEHSPVPLNKPKPPPKRIPRGAPPPRVAPVPVRPPPPQIPQLAPDQPYIKDVEPFDFEKAQREGLERAQKEKEDDGYKIKTVEDFDFEAARRAGQQAEPDRVKVVEDFDFEGARRAGAQQPQGGSGGGGGKVIEDFDFDAARRGQVPPQQSQPSNTGFDFAAAQAKVAAAAAARYAPQ